MSYEEGLKRLNRKSEVKEAIARRLHEEQSWRMRRFLERITISGRGRGPNADWCFSVRADDIVPDMHNVHQAYDDLSHSDKCMLQDAAVWFYNVVSRRRDELP